MEGSIVRGMRRRVVCKENGCPARGLGENSFFTLYFTYKNRKILVVSLSLPVLPLSLKRGRKPQSRVLIRHSLVTSSSSQICNQKQRIAATSTASDKLR
jgi:hypothetical protein